MVIEYSAAAAASVATATAAEAKPDTFDQPAEQLN